jgi:hypothetical protein
LQATKSQSSRGLARIEPGQEGQFVFAYRLITSLRDQSNSNKEKEDTSGTRVAADLTAPIVCNG